MPKAIPLVLALTLFFAKPCSPFTLAQSFKAYQSPTASSKVSSSAAAASHSPSTFPSSSSSIGWRHPLRFNLELKRRKRPTPFCLRASAEQPAFFYRKESGEIERPPVLGNVSVVLMGTKLPVSVGMVARACASFEVWAPH